jgi:hypothetical protein
MVFCSVALASVQVFAAIDRGAIEMTGSVDTGVGERGVALESSPVFERGGVPVTMENVVRAETAKYFSEETLKTGPNRFRHEREGIQLDAQTVIRSNFDQIYSYGVFDASAGLTVTVPDYEYLQLVQIFDENHVTLEVVYQGKTAHISPEDLTYGSHVYLFMRTQPPSYGEEGMAVVRRRQDSVVVHAGSGRPYVPDVKYDLDTFNTLRFDLLRRAVEEPAQPYLGFIERLEDINTPQYQMVNLAGWGGLPVRHAHYIPIDPKDPKDPRAAAGAPSSMTFAPPQLRYDDGGYWSLTVYSEDGWVVTDRFNTNSHRATPNADGTYTLTFNGEGEATNPLDVAENWNGLLRCYLPTSVEGILAFEEDLANHPIVPSTH